MEKSHRSIKFDKKYLNSLKEDGHACVDVIKDTRHLSLHPFHLSNVNNSVKEILSERIAKYDKKLNGILLSFQSIKLLRSIGSISFDSSFTHIDIEAEFFVFKPEIDSVLRGIVNKKSKDHVGCLVHKFFNVSLPRPVNCENWLGSVAQIGHEIEFRIIFTNLEARLPYIKAEIISLLSEDSGISTGEEGNNHAVNTITKFNTSGDEDEESAANASSYIKESRKCKFSEHITDHDSEESEAQSSHHKHKKRKRANSIIESSSYTLTGILNYIEEQEASERKKIKSSNEKDKGKSSKKKKKFIKHDSDENQEREYNLAVTDQVVSKNRKMKRKMSEPDDNPFISKRKKIASEVQELDSKQAFSKIIKNESSIINQIKDERKKKSSADETLSDLNLSALFNDSFTERKYKSKKKHKAEDDLNKSLNEKESRERQQSNSKKKQKNDAAELNKFITKKESRELLQSKSTKEKRPNETSPSKLNLIDSFSEKFKRKKKTSSDLDLLRLNFEDIIDQSIVQEIASNAKRNHKNEKTDSYLDTSKVTLSSDISRREKRRSKSQPRGTEIKVMDQSIFKSEARRSKSQAREVETNFDREMCLKSTKSESEKKRSKNESRDTEITVMDQSISKNEKKRSKSQPKDIESVFNSSKSMMNLNISKKEKKRSNSQCSDVESKVARELFPTQTNNDEKSKSKKNKKKHLDLSLLQINFDDIINESAVETKNIKSKEKHKKKQKRNEVQDADVSLPELNLDELFSEGFNKRHSTVSSHDGKSWQNKTFELPSDSDMENILSSCFPKSAHKKKKT